MLLDGEAHALPDDFRLTPVGLDRRTLQSCLEFVGQVDGSFVHCHMLHHTMRELAGLPDQFHEHVGHFSGILDDVLPRTLVNSRVMNCVWASFVGGAGSTRRTDLTTSPHSKGGGEVAGFHELRQGTESLTFLPVSGTPVRWLALNSSLRAALIDIATTEPILSLRSETGRNYPLC